MNNIVLGSGSISPEHISLDVHGEEIRIKNISKNKKLFVNDVIVDEKILFHGDIISVGSYIILFDDQETIEKSPVVDTKVHSRIESRQKHYKSPQHVLQNLGDLDKSHGRLIVLYKVSNAISGVLDLDQVLQKFLDIILEEFPADRAFIMLYDEIKENLFPVAIHTTTNVDKNARISQSILNEVLSTKESLLCENIMKDERFNAKDSLIDQNITSAICVPLILKNEILGLIYLDSGRENLFMSSDLDLLTKIALQASVVIENARLYKAHQKFNNDLISLSHATQNLSSSFDQQDIVTYAVEYAAQILNCKKSFLILQMDGEYRLCSSVGIDKKMHGLFQIPKSLEDVICNNKPILVQSNDDLQENLLTIKEQGMIDGTCIVVPIAKNTDKQNTMGVLAVSQKKGKKALMNEDVQILTILAGYTAVALANAKLYRDLQKKEEEIACWNQELEERVAERTNRIESMHDQLIHSEKMAAVGLLAAGVSHEFNNIIASMYGFSQIAKKNEAYKDRLVDIVIEQCQKACDITEGLLSFSKQRGDVEELVNIENIIESILKLTKPALEKEGISLVRNYQKIGKTYTISDKLKQAFLHIIINARDAIEDDGVITINIWEKDQNAHISIQDNGRGIKEENIKKVFEPFFTTKGSFGSGTQPGTGIGLSICYNIIKSLKGNIFLKSNAKEGTTVTIALPIHHERGKYSITRRIPKKTGQTAIVTEKEEDTRSLLCTILEGQGLQVYPYENGEESLENCEGVIQLWFLDIGIYEELEAKNKNIIAKIKEKNSQLKVIFLVKRAECADVLEYVKKADGYIRKPFDINDIYSIVKLKNQAYRDV